LVHVLNDAETAGDYYRRAIEADPSRQVRACARAGVRARVHVCVHACAHACGCVRACLFVVHRLTPALLQETISAYAELLYMWCVCLLACVRP
jgi:hypothetical protein